MPGRSSECSSTKASTAKNKLYDPLVLQPTRTDFHFLHNSPVVFLIPPLSFLPALLWGIISDISQWLLLLRPWPALHPLMPLVGSEGEGREVTVVKRRDTSVLLSMQVVQKTHQPPPVVSWGGEETCNQYEEMLSGLLLLRNSNF